MTGLRKKAGLRRFAAGLALAAAACAHAPSGAPEAMVWQGEVRVRGLEVIPIGRTLRIRPGTQVIFEYRDEDGDGKGDAGLLVQGRIVARGRAGAQIVFRPASPGSKPGWGEIRVEDAAGAEFSRCSFTGAQWAVHAHRTPARVAGCTFEKNEGGVKFRGDPVEIRGSLFRDNGTAVRYWESGPRLEGNRFEGNGTAIFCREGSRGGVIRGNNFSASADYHLKLGELQSEDLDARGNWWGTASEEKIEELIFDRADVAYLGRVRFRPYATGPLPIAAVDAEELR